MTRLRRRKFGTVAALLLMLAGMTGLTAASVPLYRLFCRVTGYQGTTQVAVRAPDQVLDQIVTVRFNADVSPDLSWTFVAPQAVQLKLGERALAIFKARNDSGKPVTGTAVFNVTPDEAGRFFAKIACFCFKQQTLAPGQVADLPVSFFVDPKMLKDPDAGGIRTITLSYTFFPAPGAQTSAPSADKATLN